MSKGSSQPAGYTNVTNPAQVAQQPFLNYGWGEAKNLYQNNPQTYYPGQTLAPYMAPNPAQQQGYQALFNEGAGNVMQGLQPQANALFGQAAGGGMSGGANPATPYYQGYAQGTSPIAQNFQGLQQGAQQAGGQYAQEIGQYAPQFQQTGQQAQQTGTQYAQNLAGYSNPMQQTGQQAYGAAQGYAGNIAGYSDPMAQYAAQAAGNNNMGLNSLMSTAAGQGAGMEQLARSASGQYVGQNPYLAGAMQAAIDPVTRNYQTAIAPGIDAAAAQSGRGRSGAVAGMANTAQQNLLRETGNITQEMSNANLARERQLQDAAAQQYAGQMTQAGQAGGQLYNAGLGLGMTGLTNAAGLQRDAASAALAGAQAQQQGLLNAAGTQQQAGGLSLSAADRALTGLTGAQGADVAGAGQYWQGQQQAQEMARQQAAANQYGITGLGSGFNQGNQNMLEAMRQYPQLAQAQFLGPNAQIEAGKGLTGLDQTYRNFLQQQIDDERKRYEGNQMAPYNTLNAYMQSIGDPQGGSRSEPYFRNQGAEIMSGLTGAVGLGKSLMGGLSKI